MDRQTWGKLVGRSREGEADKGFVEEQVGDGQYGMERQIWG